MLEILASGVIESEDQLLELTERSSQVIIPNGNDDLDLTHWWIVRDDGEEMLYIGTLDTFTAYTKERNGGVQ
jgi:hypothetical protein